VFSLLGSRDRESRVPRGGFLLGWWVWVVLMEKQGSVLPVAFASDGALCGNGRGVRAQRRPWDRRRAHF
jgi:hypothetical protein